jgi:hypothetical protein
LLRDYLTFGPPRGVQKAVGCFSSGFRRQRNSNAIWTVNEYFALFGRNVAGRCVWLAFHMTEARQLPTGSAKSPFVASGESRRRRVRRLQSGPVTRDRRPHCGHEMADNCMTVRANTVAREPIGFVQFRESPSCCANQEAAVTVLREADVAGSEPSAD